MDRLRSDDRGVSPVVGKTLAAGIAVLYVAGVTGLLLGGVVPGYQAAAGDEVGERVLATAAGTAENAVPAVDGSVESETTAALPATIRDSSYRLVLSNRTLELDHPEESIGAETRLSLPEGVSVENGTWQSGTELVVRVEGPATNRTLAIGEKR